MKKIIFLILFSSCIIGAAAQHPTCNGNRYKNYTFFAVDSAINVKYGQNNTMNHIPQNLVMDIYQPIPDAATKRPLIIFIHGGAFVGGSRKDLTAMSILFAARGFVTATIDYRLIDVPVVDSITVTEGMIQAVSDAKAAVRYFVEDAATTDAYKIDTNYIFISGGSAGAITAAQVAYMNSTDNIPPYILNLISGNGGFTGNSSANTSHTVSIKGVLNYSGALWRKDWISAGEPPLYSAHDIGDSIVPCNHGLSKAFAFPAYLEGSCVMKQEADLKGVLNRLYLNNSNGHGDYFASSPTVDTVLQQSADFLYDIICTNILAINESENMETGILIHPNPATDEITVSISNSRNEKERIQIFNSMGVLCKEVDVEKSTQIDIAGLSGGLYFIHLNNDLQQSQKFIKQ